MFSFILRKGKEKNKRFLPTDHQEENTDGEMEASETSYSGDWEREAESAFIRRLWHI